MFEGKIILWFYSTRLVRVFGVILQAFRQIKNIHSFFSFSAGVLGVVCLLLSVRLAHASLEHKLKARRLAEEKRIEMQGNVSMVGVSFVRFRISIYKPQQASHILTAETQTSLHICAVC